MDVDFLTADHDPAKRDLFFDPPAYVPAIVLGDYPAARVGLGRGGYLGEAGTAPQLVATRLRDQPCTSGLSLRTPFCLLLRTALKDSPQGPPTANRQPPTVTNRQPPTAANRQPPTAANRQPPTAANRQPPPTANRQPPPTANRQPPPTANRQPPPTANRQPPILPTAVHLQPPPIATNRHQPPTAIGITNPFLPQKDSHGAGHGTCAGH